MKVARLPDGKLRVPIRAEGDGVIGDGMQDVGPGDTGFEEWDTWLKANPGGLPEEAEVGESLDVTTEQLKASWLLATFLEHLFDPSSPLEMRLIQEAGFTGTLTDKSGRKRTYQDGKQVAAQQPTTNNQRPPASTDAHTPPTADDVLPGLSEKVAKVDPAAAKKPGLMHRLGDAAIMAVAKTQLFLLKHHEKIDAIGTVLGAVLDTPSDMLTKFGYNPTASSGSAHADAQRHADPVSNATGGMISAHLAATIATHAITAAFKLVGKVRGRSEAVASMDDVYELAGQLLGDTFAAVNGALGLEGSPTAAAIAAKLRELHGRS